jgi:hypothetical protein
LWLDRSPVCPKGSAVRPTPSDRSAITTSPRAWSLATTPPLPREEQDDPRRYSRAGPWGAFRAGLACVVWAVVAAMLLVVLLAILCAPGPRGEKTEAILRFVSLGVGLAAAGLTLVGCAMCCTIPRQARATGWAMTFIVSLATAFPLFCVYGITSVVFYLFDEDLLGGLVLALGLLAVWAALLLNHFSFLSLLRAAARFWGEDALARSFLRYFRITVVQSVAAVALYLAVYDVGRRYFLEQTERILAVGGGTLALGLLGQFAWCLVLLRRLRRRIL